MCVRGLKLIDFYTIKNPIRSHAVCVRGLKLRLDYDLRDGKLSHAVCVRGLKLIVLLSDYVHVQVARRVRAWIETKELFCLPYSSRSHAVCVRGLKQTRDKTYV